MSHVLYFRTEGGPDTRASRYFIIEKAKCTLIDGKSWDSHRFPRIKVEGDLDDPTWPHYLITTGSAKKLRSMKTQGLSQQIKEQLFTCQDVTKYFEKNPPLLKFPKGNKRKKQTVKSGEKPSEKATLSDSEEEEDMEIPASPRSRAQQSTSGARTTRASPPPTTSRAQRASPTPTTSRALRASPPPTTSRAQRASPTPTTPRAQQSTSGAAGSTSEGLVSSSSTRVEATSSAETISEYDYMFAWMNMPSDWLQKSSLNQILFHYAVKFFEGLKSGSHFFESSTDYIENIKKLINCDYVPKLPSLKDKPKAVADYQIISPDGKLWQQFQLNELIRTEHLIKDKSHENYSFCVSPLCKDCTAKPNKKTSAAAKTAQRHIYDLMGIKWHCVMCSMVFNTKTTHDSHVKACIYRERAAREHPIVSKNYERQDSRRRDGRVTITAIGNTQFGFRLVDWLKVLIQHAKEGGFLQNKTIEVALDEFKKNPDYCLIAFYKELDQMLNQDQKFKVLNVVRDGEEEEDNYYTVIYPGNPTEPLKSAHFRMIERRKKKSVSIYRLEEIREATLSENDDKCHYNGCQCKGSFTNPDRDALIGHILQTNILITCSACDTGFTEFLKFEEHLNPSCFTPRMSGRQRVIARIE